jgi:predicted DNA-binding transcriptional regulator AlpA
MMPTKQRTKSQRKLESQFPRRVIRWPEAKSRSGYKSDTAFKKAIERGELPKPFRISDTGRLLGWFASDWDDWEAQRKQKRDTEQVS